MVLPYINMSPPQVYTCSPSWTPLPPPSPYHPSPLSRCTSPKHPVSCIEPGLAIRFIYDIILVSMPFSQIIPPSPSPTGSKRLFYTSVSVLLFCIQGFECEVELWTRELSKVIVWYSRYGLQMRLTYLFTCNFSLKLMSNTVATFIWLKDNIEIRILVKGYFNIRWWHLSICARRKMCVHVQSSSTLWPHGL